MADTRDFLLEIGCEEMPSAPLMKAQDQLGKLVSKELDAAGLSYGEVRTLSTPRRLAVIVSDLASQTEAVHELMRGPKVQIAFDAEGMPTNAAKGFARKAQIDPSQLVRKVDADGNEYIFAERDIASVSAQELLGPLSERVIGSIQWPNYRSQRWGSEHQSFVRPIRWICSLFGTDVVVVHYADVCSSNTTRGHRVLAPGEHQVESPAVYEQVLESACVLGEKRRSDVIRAGIAAIESARGGAHVETPKATFDEVVNLCEWPTVLVGTFDEDFLSVPHEIIVEAMLKHQRYFPIYASDGALTREFVIVSNADPAVSDTVRSGNERVVRPRLDDAKFFYEEDLKVGLSALRERLSEVVFQKSLGTVLQKSDRMEDVARAVASQLDDKGCIDDAVRAAHLAKADLVSQAVIEFTSQQGVMGGYYAKAQGENDRVARAISEHYRPRFAGDELPSDVVGIVVAIADKLDTVCGMFAINEPPTGSADPFAVRRSAIGVIAMLRALSGVNLDGLIDVSLGTYAAQGIQFDLLSVRDTVRAYFAGRLAAIAKDEGADPDTITAVMATGVCDPAAFLGRVQALTHAQRENSELFSDLAVAYARASHLADRSLGTQVDAEVLGDAEQSLLKATDIAAQNVEKSLAEHDYNRACSALAALREPIDRFFDEVLVMDSDTRIREMRLRLLNRFVAVFDDVADISALSRKK